MGRVGPMKVLLICGGSPRDSDPYLEPTKSLLSYIELGLSKILD